MSDLLLLDDLLLKKIREKIVLVTGCFDILHTEHIKFLKSAKTRGDILVVGLESDKRVRELKGKGRPVNKINKRALNIQKQKIANYIFPLPDNFGKIEQQENLIKKMRPHILAVSAHTLHQDEKKRIMNKYGGSLQVVLPFNPKISTTQLLDKKLSCF